MLRCRSLGTLRVGYLAPCRLASHDSKFAAAASPQSTLRLNEKLPAALPRAILKLLTILVLIGAIQARANFSDDTWIFHAPDGKAHTFKRAGKTRGSPMIRLEDIAKEFHLKLSYNPESFKV